MELLHLYFSFSYPDNQKTVTINAFEQIKCKVADPSQANLKKVAFSNENFFIGCPEFVYENLPKPETYPTFTDTTTVRKPCTD